MSTLPQSKRESCRRHNMKRTETMGKKPDQISASLHRYLSRLPHLISSHPTPSASSTPTIQVFLLRETYEQKAKYRSELPSTPISTLIRSSTFNVQPPAPPPSPYSPAMAHYFPFLSPTSVLFHLSYTRESSSRRPSRSSISVVCVSQVDGQFPLLAVSPLDWNVDEPRTRWLEMTWMG